MVKTIDNDLPQDHNPDGDICVPVFVPNDTEWLWTLAQAVSIPSMKRFWIDTQDGTSEIVRDNWETRVAQPLEQAIIDGLFCSDEGDGEGSLGQCFRMDTTTEIFDFSPNDPFTDPFNNDGKITLNQMAWRRWSEVDIFRIPFLGNILEGFTSTALGYFPNDIMLVLDTFPLFQNPIERIADILSVFTHFPLPYVYIELEGEGQFEVELVNVPYGGLCLLIPDLDISIQGVIDILIEWFDNDGELPNFWVMTELDRDILQGELVATQVQEFEFVGDEKHTMHCIFIPQPTIEPPWLNPFGGIREIEACGSLRVIGAQTGETYTKQNYGVLDTKRKGVIGVSTVQDICNGIICAIEELSGRILFANDKDNILSSISVDKDTGTVTLQQADIDRDDIDGTAQEKRYGGVYEQAKQIAQLFADINEYMDIPYANATIYKLTKSFVGIDAIEDPDLSTDWDTAVGAYITADPDLVIDIDALALRFFCESISGGATSYAIDDESYSEANLNLFTDILVLIPKPTYSLWYKNGSYVPLDGYQSAPCYRFPNAEMVYTVDDLASAYKSFTIQPNFTVGSATNDRRRTYRVEITGLLVGDNYRWDGMFLTALPSGVPTYEPLDLRHIEAGVNPGGTYNPVVSPPYDPSTGYETTIIVGFTTPNSLRLHGIHVPEAIQTDDNVTGTLVIICRDLGHPDG